MNNAHLLFWDVDTQFDFIDPAGKLYVPGAEDIVPNIQRLNHWAGQNQVLVISSTDAHLHSDPEFQEYPPHCLAGTAGQAKAPGTVLPQHYVIPNRKVELPRELDSYQQIIIEKQAVDVFTNPNIDALLSLIGKGRRVILYGVVTEICLDRAARGLIARGYTADVVGDAMQHLEASKGQRTIDEIRRHGGHVLRTEDVVATVVEEKG